LEAEAENVNQKTEIAVVGGGPCGSFSALTAAKLGADVAVFEEHKEIGVPSHCPGHISLKGLQQLGVSLPQKIFENKIKAAVFHSSSGRELRVRFASPVTCVLNRALFDRHLAELAEKAGVKYHLRARVDSFVWGNGFVRGVSVKGDTMKSNVVIDSEGCSSILLKKSELATLDKSMVVNGVEGEVDQVKDVDQDTVEVYLGRNYAPGLYAWIIPRRDGSAKVGLATKAGNPRKYLEYFVSHNPQAREKLKQSRFVNVSYHPITLGGPIAKTYYNGLLIVGDAASHVKPTTGGGVIMGLNCAKIAAETTYQAIKRGDCSENFLSLYQQRWRKAIGFDMAVMRQIRLMLNRLSDDKLDKLISLCSELHVDETLQEVKDIDFQGRALLPVFKSPNIWILVFYFFLASIT
jgi:digeranylgeranylglycerophospholipid reductase